MKELKTLVYASTAHSWVSEFDLKTMLHKSRDYNKGHGLTGVLIYEDGSFLQTIEGPPEEVDLVFDRISKSQKHYNIQLILEAPILARSFPNWSMGFIEMPKDNFLRQSANQWKIFNSWPYQKEIHIGAKMIQNYWKRHQSVS
jgi:Sensors of blue-light using FAD